MRRGRILGKIAEDVLLSQSGIMSLGLDIVGDIAIIKISEAVKDKHFLIAKTLLGELPHVKTVLRQSAPVSGEHRIRGFEWLAGEKKYTALYTEYGCRFKIDLKKVFFSPRLSYERFRVSKLVQERFRHSMTREIIVNMFAGVGCFSIVLAKHTRIGIIYSIDINHDAVQLMKQNILLNRLEEKIIAIEGDAKNIVMSKLQKEADRILMPLPEKAYEYLHVALEALKPSGGWIHYYDFCHSKKGEDPQKKVIKKVHNRLKKYDIHYKINYSRIVRNVGPRRYQIVLDIQIIG